MTGLPQSKIQKLKSKIETPCFRRKQGVATMSPRMFLRETSSGQRLRAEVPDSSIWDMGFRNWDFVAASYNPKSEIPHPKSKHGDAIVRDLHPTSLSLKALFDFQRRADYYWLVRCELNAVQCRLGGCPVSSQQFAVSRERVFRFQFSVFSLFEAMIVIDESRIDSRR